MFSLFCFKKSRIAFLAQYYTGKGSLHTQKNIIITYFKSFGSKPFIVEAGELNSLGSKLFIVEAGELISSGSQPFKVEAG